MRSAMSTAPDSVSKKLLEIPEEAIEPEQFSQQRYATGARLAPDLAAEETSLRLVEDEMSHEGIPRERLVALKDKEGSQEADQSSIIT